MPGTFYGRITDYLHTEGIDPQATYYVCGSARIVRDISRIIQAGGYISVNTGAAPDAHATPVPKQDADRAFEAAACIGCGACVAACPNASAMLFTSAKVTHLGLLPQGKPENYKRVVNMLNQMDEEGFGSCSNIGECAAVCPKQIPLDVIANLNRQLGKAAFKGV